MACSMDLQRNVSELKHFRLRRGFRERFDDFLNRIFRLKKKKNKREEIGISLTKIMGVIILGNPLQRD